MYFDPGTGSMIIQILLAGIASCGAIIFAFKNKLKSFFRKVFKKDAKK